MTKKTIFYSISLLLLVSCGGNNESKDAGSDAEITNPKAFSKSLVDSANAMIGEFGVSAESKELIDKAISIDPSNKRAHSKKLAILTSEKDYSGLKKTLDEMKTQFPEDPYIAMYATMEEELQAVQMNDYQGYVSSFETYIGVLDTLTPGALIIRNGYIGNAALSARLAELDKTDAIGRISPTLKEGESKMFEEMFLRFESQSREDILKARRN